MSFVQNMLSVMAINELRETNASIAQQVREELKEQGTLLPIYTEKTWEDTMEIINGITDDWFERHPEVTRGTGEFDKKYPSKGKAIDLLYDMCLKNRIKPNEYIILHRELHNF